MSPEPDRCARVDPDVKAALGSYNALGIEIAFNAGIPVEMPAIPGLSPNVRVRHIQLAQSVENIMADPTDEERARWQGMTEEQIR